MRPFLFEWRGRQVHAYPVFLSIGLTFGIVAGLQAGRARGLQTMPLYVALVVLTIPALVGSRLLFAACNWRQYRHDLRRLWSRESGGLALYGGLLLALACSWPVTRLLGLPFAAIWEAATTTLLVGKIFTNMGCLLGGCCAGRETSAWWGMTLPNAQGIWRRRVPAQILEAGLALGLFVGTLRWPAPRPEGARFLVCLAVYAAARMAMEPTREEVDRVAGVSAYGALSVALLLVAVIALYARSG
jgi:phosphatidylglycerol:prolipoprotein diacylglycerol transferase